MNWLKKNPAAVYAIIITAFATFNSEALANHLLASKTLTWLDLVFAVITAAGGVIVHNTVTPLADPKLDSQTPLVPVNKVLPPSPAATNVTAPKVVTPPVAPKPTTPTA